MPSLTPFGNIIAMLIASTLQQLIQPKHSTVDTGNNKRKVVCSVTKWPSHQPSYVTVIAAGIFSALNLLLHDDY